jgi:sugar/nucleoside kinase (ribokinase family)
MITVMGSLIADINLGLQKFPVTAGSMHRLSHLATGPGGVNNVAIMAARLGLPVCCLGEIGGDAYGEVILQGLEREGVEIEHIVVTPDAETPVAVVAVDNNAEPAFLGYRGSLKMATFPREWRGPIRTAQALFADGFVVHPDAPNVIREGLRVAREAGVKTFFDPGPSHSDGDETWRAECIQFTDVLLANRREAEQLTGIADPEAAGAALLGQGPKIVVVKCGEEGCILLSGDENHHAGGYKVDAQDTTGAGDSAAGAVIYGVLKGFPLPELAVFANLVAAAKVQKMGTGHSMPTTQEIQAVIDRFQVRFSTPLW